MNLDQGDFCSQQVEGNMWSGLAEVGKKILAPNYIPSWYKQKPQPVDVRGEHGGHNDREEDEAKLGFI